MENYNIFEQRHWNSEDAFIESGDEWSGRYGTTENLFNQLLKSKVESYCKGEGLEIAPGWNNLPESAKERILDEYLSTRAIEAYL